MGVYHSLTARQPNKQMGAEHKDWEKHRLQEHQSESNNISIYYTLNTKEQFLSNLRR